MLVGPSKCVKQIIQIELNRVKNPNWLEANQLAIYKHGQGWDYREQIQLAVGAACKKSSVRYPGASGFCYRASEFCS